MPAKLLFVLFPLIIRYFIRRHKEKREYPCALRSLYHPPFSTFVTIAIYSLHADLERLLIVQYLKTNNYSIIDHVNE